MKNLLISAAMGDYAGSAYEGKHRRTKQYDKVKMFSSRARFTDDTVLTFACAEAFIRDEILAKYYPQWAGISYAELHDTYEFTTSCRKTVGPAIICFLESKDYVDCIRLAISLGADADTLAAISGPMAYAYYREMPEELVEKVVHALPKWMQVVNKEFDEVVNNGGID